MQEETVKKNTKKSQQGGQYRMYVTALVALLVVVGGGYYGWMRYQAYRASPEVQTAKAEAEKKDILDAISKFMLLPEGDPVLFKVSNRDQMRAQQAFFKDTENDDVLLVFQQSGKAIIYRPSSKTIINVGPVNFDNTQAPNQTRPAGNTSTSTKK
jgi:hypothetical protein